MGDRAVQIEELGALGLVQLKSWAREPASDLRVPQGADRQFRILGYSPNEWLAISDTLAGSDLCERLSQHVKDQCIAATDVSCALKVLRVEGPCARSLLTQGCGLDLNPNAFPAGACTRTRFAQIAVIVNCIDSAERFDLYAGRSYLAYLKSWLEDASLGEVTRM
jgi:sarcosine oxidase subunit gamma